MKSWEEADLPERNLCPLPNTLRSTTCFADDCEGSVADKLHAASTMGLDSRGNAVCYNLEISIS